MRNGIALRITLAFALIISLFLPYPSVEAKTKVSYLMDTKKVYTYDYYDYSGKKNFSETLKFHYKHEHLYFWSTGHYDIAYFEDAKALYDGDGNELLEYPVKKNKTWSYEGINYKITSIKTVKVKAGTFKNVVILKSYRKGYKDYSLTYYAPNVGLIMDQHNNKETKYKTKTVQELSKLKNK